MTRVELVRSPLVTTLAELDQVANNFNQIGPVPSAILLNLIVDEPQYLHPVHKKLINRLTRTIEMTAPELPPTLSIQVFNTLYRSGHPLARRVLSDVQSKWFDNWQPASVERGSRRPKLKQNFVGAYSEDALSNYRILHSGLIRNLDDATLREACENVVRYWRDNKTPVIDVALIGKALLKEYTRRFAAGGTDQSVDSVKNFIHDSGILENSS